MDKSAMTLIDEMRGAYIVAFGASFRLWFEGGVYGPDDVVPVATSEFRDLQAWEYVIDHLTRRLGANREKWPVAARFFLTEAKAYVVSADPDGTLVAFPATRALGNRPRFDRH